MSFRSALKHRFVAFAVKLASATLFPIAIARAYGADVNGDVQLLVTSVGYLGLLDSGMTISAINLGRDLGADDPHENAANVSRIQDQASRKIIFVGISISVIFLLLATWRDWIDSSVLFAGGLLALLAVLEIAFTPYKYHLYAHGRSGFIERREARFSVIATCVLFCWSALILKDVIPLVVALPVGLLLLRADRASSSIMCRSDLRSLASKSSSHFETQACSQNAMAKDQQAEARVREQRIWISTLQVLALLNWSIDIFMIKFLIGSSAVSDYSILVKLFTIPVSLVVLANPIIQSAVNQGRLAAQSFQKIFRSSWILIVALTTLLASVSAALFYFLPSLSSFLGLTVMPTMLLLISFSLLSILSVFSSLYAPVANGLNLIKCQVVISAICLPVNITLSWVFGGHCNFGIAGVVGATGLTMAFTSCLLVPIEILKRLQHYSETKKPSPLGAV